MGVNDWVGFRVGEQLFHQVGDVIQSGSIVGYVAQGRLGKIRTYCEAPCVGFLDEGRIANEVVHDRLTVGLTDV